MIKYVTAKIFISGLHCWPKCNIDEVSFLKHSHRHLFVIKTILMVFESDREVEFFMLQDEVRKIIKNKFSKTKLDMHDFGESSCEMIAEFICDKLVKKYGKNRDVFVEVEEDGENGGIAIHDQKL